MTKKELATKLNRREYREEISPEECSQAKAAGLLVIFGASDDLCELRGVIDDEVQAVDGSVIRIAKTGQLLPDEIDHREIEVLQLHGAWEFVQQLRADATQIKIRWCASPDLPDLSWYYETAMSHATFDIIEDGGVYCRGIVIDLKDDTTAER